MEENCRDNPMQLFQLWFYYVKDNYPQIEVNAMSLTTIQPDGYPRNRIVLLKYYSWEGFTFFTNYKSDKARAIFQHNKVSLIFNWRIANKEVHIHGDVEKVPEEVSARYFETRPRASQIGAWVSNQSEVINSRAILEKSQQYYEKLFEGKPITKPKHWGGFLIKPKHLTFYDLSQHHEVKSIAYELTEDFFWKVEECLEKK